MTGVVKRPDDVSDEEYVRTINAFAWDGRSAQVGFRAEPVEGAAENYASANLEDLRADRGSLWSWVRDLIQLRRTFRVDTETQLTVRRDLYGHVAGWTLRHADGRCLTAVVNLSATETYRVPAEAADARCVGGEVVAAYQASLRGEELVLGPYSAIAVGM